MINWKYEDFYDWYINNYGTMEDDGTLMKIIHMKRYNKKYKLKDFVHDKRKVIVRKLDGLKTVIENTDNFPLGMYVFLNLSKKDEELKRLYFVFPSYKKSTINKEEESELIADHYTFLLSSDEKDKRPVKTHLTLYVPNPNTIHKGFTAQEDSYISREFQISQFGYQPNVFSSFGSIMNNTATDIMRKPYIIPITRESPSTRKKIIQKKDSKTKNTISSRLIHLLLKHNVINVVSIGIKLKNERKYTYTVFVTFEMNEDMEEDEENDSLNYTQPIPSFVFKENGTYKSFEERLTEMMKDWDERPYQ
jgi:hypothetical protein